MAQGPIFGQKLTRIVKSLPQAANIEHRTWRFLWRQSENEPITAMGSGAI